MVDPFEQLQRLVLGDPVLCRTLWDITDHQEFVKRVADLAGQHGLPIDDTAVSAALAAARRIWLERWI